MKQGNFCFLTDQYFVDFPDPGLMHNYEISMGGRQDRPCFFAFPDKKDSSIFWLVPVSSKIEKYQRIYDAKMAKRKVCDNIHFGYIAGGKSAFLIQNMCPATAKYINNIYVDSKNVPIGIDSRTGQEVEQKARRVLGLDERGVKLLFPDVKTIYAQLSCQLAAERAALAATAAPPVTVPIASPVIVQATAAPSAPVSVTSKLAQAAQKTDCFATTSEFSSSTSPEK